VPNWFVNIEGTTTGPHPADHVRHWLTHGQLPPSALFWPDGGSAWLEASEAALRLGSEARPTPAASSPWGPHPGPADAPPPRGDAVVAASGPPAGDDPMTDSYPGHAAYRAPYAHGTHALPEPSRSGLQAFTHRLADFAGVERITGFRPAELLSLALRKHSRDELEQTFATGLPGFTPPLEKVHSDWPKPWIFVRLYAAASALFLGFLGLFEVFHNTNLLPGMIMMGSFAVPLAVLVLFFELNTPRNVSLYTVTHAFLTGGVISLAITLVLIQVGSSSDPIAGPLLTAVLEEVGKLLAVFVVALRMPGLRYPWILNGMLFGAAVGAGFAAFESAGYALNTILTTARVEPAINVILLRGALAPFGHVVWTALVAGALWRVKRERTMTPTMLVDARVLRVLALAIAMHALWDYGFQLPFMVKYAALGLLAWILVLGMITSGLKQIKATQVSAARGGSHLPQPTALQPTVPPVGSR